MKNNNYTYSGGGQIAQGAISGAMTGAAFGPWGILGGAALGGTMGYLQNQNQPINTSPQTNVQSLGNPVLSFAGGGITGNQINTNQFTELQGPPHEQGGIQIAPGQEVEGGETKSDNYIFSDRIKPKGSTKTYAQLSKDIENKYKMRKGDKLAEESKERDFAKLREKQESDPAILKLRAKTNKEKFAGGGIMDPLPMKNPSLINNNYQGPILQGGNPIDYSTMGTNNFIPMDGNLDYKQVYGPGTDTALKNLGNVGGANSYTNSVNTANPITNQPQSQPQVNNVQGLLKSLEGMPSGVENTQPQAANNNLNPYWIGALGNSIGPASQLIGSLINKADTTNFDRVNPSFINTDQLQNSLNRQAGFAYNNLNRNVSSNARTSGELMSNIVAGNSSINNNLMNQLASIEQNKLNTNAQIANNTKGVNAQIQMQEQIANEQNKAAYRTSVYGSLTDLGNIGAGTYKDYNMQKANDLQNQRLLNTLNSMGFNYKTDSQGNITFVPIQ